MERRRTKKPWISKWVWMWVIGSPVSWPLWWAKELLIGLAIGLVEGIVISIYEVRAEKILARWKRKGISIYNTKIWGLLRKIAFEPHVDRYGIVVCQRCLIPTEEPHCHHIKWLSRRPDLAFTIGNLSPRCPKCHQAEHPKINILREGQAA